MKIGDKVTVKCRWVDEQWDARRKRTIIEQENITGRVIYIHPNRRFCRVEFKFPNGKYCECFEMGGTR